MYLGRPFKEEKGLGLMLEAAKQLPDIRFIFAVPRVTEADLTIQLQSEISQVPNAQLTTAGINGRASLLCSMRVAAVLGRTDWQWLPGTEMRGAHGVALAGRGTPVEAWNGTGLDYFLGIDELVEKIKLLHEDDEYFEEEARSQHE